MADLPRIVTDFGGYSIAALNGQGYTPTSNYAKGLDEAAKTGQADQMAGLASLNAITLGQSQPIIDLNDGIQRGDPSAGPEYAGGRAFDILTFWLPLKGRGASGPKGAYTVTRLRVKRRHTR